jgi:hypothetical protein
LRCGDSLVDLVLLAWGDFNGDRIEDVLLFRFLHAVENTLVYCEHVVLTRLGSQDRIIEILMDPYK